MDQHVEDQGVLFREVFSHLTEIEANQTTRRLDEDLLKRAERSLDVSTPRDLLWQILRTGEDQLQSLQQDPRPLTRLLEKTVSLIPFDELKSVISAAKLVEGLTSSSLPIQLLCLAYLRNAANLPSGASFVAADQTLVQTLMTLWLSSESTEVSERALEDIIALLTVDDPNIKTVVPSPAGSLNEVEGHGLFWRRLFHDPEIYRIFFQWTSPVKPAHDLSTKKGGQAMTISQARLFDFIERVVVLDWTAVTTAQNPQIEREYSKSVDAGQPFGGLLRFAASGMIDNRDVLMEVLRQDFFAKLLHVVEEKNSHGVSPKFLSAIQDVAGIQQTRDGTSGTSNIPIR